MTALDPFTKADAYFIDATRSMRPFKTGDAMEWMPRRILWVRLSASLLLGAIVGVSARECGAGMLVACALGAGAGLAIRLSDGWLR